MAKYVPPYTITDEMLIKVAEIVELIGGLGIFSPKLSHKLRKENIIRSVHSSLSIENVPLSLEEVGRLYDGRLVLAEKGHVMAASNALKAYEAIERMDPYEESDLLSCHTIMMDGLVEDPGSYRRGEVRVMTESGETVHLAPPPHLVPELMGSLFAWLNGKSVHPLIASSIFHYEFEFIHPFPDGNGRMGRLWQSLLLSRWKPLFRDVPIESLIYQRQREYYEAIMASDKAGESTAFILFMLECIEKALQEAKEKRASAFSPQVERLLEALGNDELSASQIMARLGLKSRSGFIRGYLRKALEEGAIAMSHPDKPTARNQAYHRIKSFKHN